MPHLISPHPLTGFIAPERIPVTWSHAQQRTLDDCARARGWASEIAPDGWRRDAAEIARVARRLTSLSTLDAEGRMRVGALQTATLRAAADQAATALESGALRFGVPLCKAREHLTLVAHREVHVMTRYRVRCARCPYLELCQPELAAAAREEVA